MVYHYRVFEPTCSLGCCGHIKCNVLLKISSLAGDVRNRSDAHWNEKVCLGPKRRKFDRSTILVFCWTERWTYYLDLFWYCFKLPHTSNLPQLNWLAVAEICTNHPYRCLSMRARSSNNLGVHKRCFKSKSSRCSTKLRSKKLFRSHFYEFELLDLWHDFTHDFQTPCSISLLTQLWQIFIHDKWFLTPFACSWLLIFTLIRIFCSSFLFNRDAKCLILLHTNATINFRGIPFKT